MTSTATTTTVRPPMPTASMHAPLSSEFEFLYETLAQFYRHHSDYMDTMVSILTFKSTISLRIIDWFVTNYAKQYGTEYALKKGVGSETGFNVNVSYKCQLTSFGKSKFDPFCRGDSRVCLPYKSDMQIKTTVGQLNFFKWVLENEILDYIADNYETINNDMQQRGSNSLKHTTTTTNLKNDTGTMVAAASNGAKTRKKRRELSVSAIKNVTHKNVEIVLKFN
jgi:hypothetical protein